MLYRHRVQYARLEPLLERLNETLSDLCGRMPEASPAAYLFNSPIRWCRLNATLSNPKQP